MKNFIFLNMPGQQPFTDMTCSAAINFFYLNPWGSECPPGI